MNTSLFAGKSQLYAQFRPSYPDALFRWLLPALANCRTAADIGAGTGQFARPLSVLVPQVYAVEPDAALRKAGAEQRPAFPSVSFLDGTAEQTNLPAASVDLVTAAQSFHWFDRTQFQAECRRILTPSGQVLLVWNDRDRTAPLIQALYAVNQQFCPAFTGFSNGMDFSDGRQFSAFFSRGYAAAVFPYPQGCTLKDFLGRNLSSSFAPRETDDAYAAYCNALRTLFHRFCTDSGQVVYPYVTRCYLGRV